MLFFMSNSITEENVLFVQSTLLWELVSWADKVKAKKGIKQSENAEDKNLFIKIDLYCFIIGTFMVLPIRKTSVISILFSLARTSSGTLNLSARLQSVSLSVTT